MLCYSINNWYICCYRVVDPNNVPLGDVGPSASGTVGEVGQTITDTDLLCPTCGFSTDKPSTYRSHIEQHNKQQTYVCVSALCVIHTRHLPSAVANSSPILFVCNIHCAVLFMTVGVESAWLVFSACLESQEKKLGIPRTMIVLMLIGAYNTIFLLWQLCWYTDWYSRWYVLVCL